MNPRNRQSNNRMIEFEVAQQMQNHQQHPEPYILLGSPPNFPQSSAHQILPTSGSINNLDGTASYRLPQYAHQVYPAPSTIYNPYLIPTPGPRMFSAPVNHGSMDQLPSSSNFGPTATHISSGHGANSFQPNVVRGSSKRNGAANGYINPPAAAAATTVAMPPMNIGQFDAGVAILDACFPLPEFGGNYIGQSSGRPPSPWCYEVSNIGGQRFNEGASARRGSQNIPRYNPMLHPLHEFHPRQAIPTHRPQAATSFSRRPQNNRTQYPIQGPDAVAPHRRSVMPEGIHRNPNVPHLRLLEEGVAILEFSGHYEMSSSVDHHRDMRLDVDYMTYEELLALSERIGNVKTGLSEKSIMLHLKTRIHRSSMASIGMEEGNDYCVICQDEYEDNDMIGTLDCGHEYHDKCLKKWLPVKNTCPICKSVAINEEDEKKSDQIQ